MNFRSLFNYFNKRAFHHLFFWLFYVLFFGSIYGKYGNNFQWYLLESVCMLPFVMFATYITIYVLLPHYLKKRNLFVIVSAIIIVLFFSTLGERIFLRKLNSLEITFDTLFTLSYIYLLLETNFIVASAVAIKIAKKWFEQQGEKHDMEKRNLETELNLLKSQLHPHFLFNTMNNLYALSLEKSTKTSEGIVKISKLLHTVLYECNDAEITLEKEVKMIENYIDLERMRYSKNFKIEFNVDGPLAKIRIAPMVLFTFIENCFKHCGSIEPENSFIKIDLNVTNEAIDFFAENSKLNSLKNKNQTESGGIGLANVKKRLEIIYGENYNLNIKNKENSFEVNLRIII